MPVYESLVARIDGLDGDTNAGEKSVRPTAMELNKLAAGRAVLRKNMGDDELTILYPIARGGTRLETVKLADTMAGLEKANTQAGVDAARINRQLRENDDEIVAARDCLVHDTDGAEKRAKDVLEAEIAAILKRMEQYKAEDLASIARAQKEDKAAIAANSKKVQEFLMALQ